MACNLAMDSFLSTLTPRFKDRLRTDQAARLAAACDASHVAPGLPDAVVWPLDTPEVVAVTQAAGAHNIALVPRGAGTGKAGGCIAKPGEVVVDFSLMRQIVHMAPQDLYATVQPGVITADLDRAAQPHGLMYPPDPASWETCSLGGNIATNAGGPRAVKYGVTGRYVWGLEVVLASGEVLRVGRHCIKGVVGPELAALFVGSEGTLGLITEATLHLVPSPHGVQTAWMTFADVHAASVGASRMLAAGLLPRMLELLDGPALQAVRPLVTWPMPQSGAALLVETDGSTEAAAMVDLLRLGEVSEAADCIVAPAEQGREAMRRTRRLVSSALKSAYPFKVSDDIAMPRSRMPELLDEAVRQAEKAGISASTYGHLGDGNLHINLLCRDAAARDLTFGIRRALYAFAVARGGSISGEHGIGLSKRGATFDALGATVYGVQRRIKTCLDPQGLLNPGKIFDPGVEP